VAKDAAKKPAKDTAKNAAKKTVKDTVKVSVKKPAKATAKDAPKKPAKDTVKVSVKVSVKKPAKDTAKDDAKAHVNDDENDGARNEAADTVEDGLKLIQSKPEGILQSELWKELGVDSRKCSRIVKKLEESGLIERVEFKKEGIKTYLLRAKQQPVNPAHLLAGDELIPCIACELECVVEECHPLMDWMYQLAIVEHTEE
jgi:Lrp/AsnC family transcriptional regulator, leucine-responsive regulatory protein